MVLYFTQSRSNITGLQVEEALGELFLGVPYNPNLSAPPLEEYLGYYWEDESDGYRAIIRDGDVLALEVRGRAVAALSYMGEDRWKIRQEPGTVLEFERSESGEVTGYHIGDHREYRFEPSPELPSIEDIVARVAQAHRLDLMESLGTMRTSSELTIESLDIKGEVTSWLAWPNHFRVDAVAGGNSEHYAYDGERVRYESTTESLTTLEGARAESLRLDNEFARFGDLLAWHPELRVIQRLDDKGREVFLLRTGDTLGPARTLYVEGESGRVRRVDTIENMGGMGRVGSQTTFGDFRDVSGMTLPFRTVTKVANQLIGTIVTTVTEIEVGVELPEGGLELGD